MKGSGEGKRQKAKGKSQNGEGRTAKVAKNAKEKWERGDMLEKDPKTGKVRKYRGGGVVYRDVITGEPTRIVKDAEFAEAVRHDAEVWENAGRTRE